jgi:hypothetical protein
MQEYRNLRQQKIANACAFCLHQWHESPSTLQTCYAKTSTPPSDRLHLSTCPTSFKPQTLFVSWSLHSQIRDFPSSE